MKTTPRKLFTFLIPLIACAAFLIGAVKLWGIPVDGLLSALVMILMLVGGVMVLAVVAVAVINLLRRRHRD